MLKQFSKMPISHTPIVLAEKIKQAYAEKGLIKSTQIAQESGINQSQIHRNLFGKPKRVTKTIMQLCKKLNIDTETDSAQTNPAANETLMSALSAVWDGSEPHAKALSRLLFAAAKIGVRE